MNKPAFEPLPHSITIRDKYGPAMEITDQTAADAYFERLLEHGMRYHTREEAERIERMNLGYYAGYYSQETRVRVEQLFHCSHPVFGAAGEPMDAQAAFLAGCQHAAKAIHGSNP